MTQSNTVALENVRPSQPAPLANCYTHAAAVRSLLDSGDITVAEVARRLNCSASKVSQYKDEIYHTKIKDLAILRDFDRQVGSYLARRQLRQRIRQRMYLPTSHARQIESYLDFCLDMAEMRVIRAGTGSGKTHVIEQYTRTHGNVYIVPCDQLRRAQKPFLNALYKEVKGEPLPARISLASAFDAVVEALKGQDALVIIDDSHHLLFNTFSQAASLCDRARVGVVFCDQSDAQDAPGYDRARQYERSPQVWGRIAEPWSAETPILKDDVTLFADQYGITNPEVIDWLYQRVNTPKTRYRWLDKLLRYAASMYTEQPERLNTVAVFKILHNKFWHGRTK